MWPSELPAAPRSEWFRTNSFSYGTFCDVAHLCQLKRERDVLITLILPARNVAATIGDVLNAVASLRGARFPLLDQVIVIDSKSSDGTAAVAERAHVEVYEENRLMPRFGKALGKGDAMWRGLSKAHGDIIAFADTDTRNFRFEFISSIVGCLLTKPGISFVKASYRRPFDGTEKPVPDGGGRVTELLAKPILNMFFPELTGFVQPLAGEFAATRELLYSVPFFTGYAVEIGLLIDAWQACGLQSMAQVDVGLRVNRHQDLASLSRMSYSILRAALLRAASVGRILARDGGGPGMRLDGIAAYFHAVARSEGLCLDEYCETLLERPPMRIELA